MAFSTWTAAVQRLWAGVNSDSINSCLYDTRFSLILRFTSSSIFLQSYYTAQVCIFTHLQATTFSSAMRVLCSHSLAVPSHCHSSLFCYKSHWHLTLHRETTFNNIPIIVQSVISQCIRLLNRVTRLISKLTMSFHLLCEIWQLPENMVMVTVHGIGISQQQVTVLVWRV